jgi:hypothetical protein
LLVCHRLHILVSIRLGSLWRILAIKTPSRAQLFRVAFIELQASSCNSQMASSTEIELPALAVPASAHTSGKDSSISLEKRYTGPAQVPLLSENEPEIFRTTTARTVEQGEIGKSASFIVITCVTCITGISALLAGLVTVMLPAMAADLHIPVNLQLWYVPWLARSTLIYIGRLRYMLSLAVAHCSF